MPDILNCGLINQPFYRTSECGAPSGIKNLWVANFSRSTVWSANTIGEIVSGGTAIPTFYPVDLRQETCQFRHDAVVNDQYGNRSMRAIFELVIVGYTQ